MHLFGNVAPVAEIEALGVPVLEDAAQAAGSRGPDGRAGRARRGGDVLLLPVQEPRRVRRRRRGHHARRRRSPSACGCCASTARATSRRSSWSATTRASTSCRRRSCACSCRTWTAGRRPPRAPPRTTRRPGSASSVDLPAPTAGAEPAWHLYVVRHARADELAAALKARRDRPARPTTACRPTASRRCATYAPRRRAAGHRRGRAHAPRDPDEPGALARAGRRGRRRGARCGSGSTSLTRRTCSSCARSSGRSSGAARGARHRARLRADARAAASASGSRTRRSAATAAAAWPPRASGCSRARRRSRAGRAGARIDVALGHGSNDVTVAARAAAASRARRRSTTSGRRSSTPSTAGSRSAVVVPDAIPPERLRRYGATPAKLRRYPGLKEEYYLADFEPDPAVLGELGLDPARPIAVVRTPPAVSLYHRFENPLFAQVLDRLRGDADRRAPAHARAARRARRLHRPRAGDRRAVARSPTPTS